MKKTVSLFVVVLCFMTGGCMKENDVSSEIPLAPDNSSSEIVVRASHSDSLTNNADEEPIVFTGSDILWFNETTKEFRFKDNFSMRDVFSGFRSFKFYMDGEYLFSMIYVTGLSSQIINSPVFYYNITENKYFLLDGYPAIIYDAVTGSWASNDGGLITGNETIQYLRDENRQKIESEWNKFINRLKKEEQYRS